MVGTGIGRLIHIHFEAERVALGESECLLRIAEAGGKKQKEHYDILFHDRGIYY
jgi:hypothetical protein